MHCIVSWDIHMEGDEWNTINTELKVVLDKHL